MWNQCLTLRTAEISVIGAHPITGEWSGTAKVSPVRLPFPHSIFPSLYAVLAVWETEPQGMRSQAEPGNEFSGRVQFCDNCLQVKAHFVHHPFLHCNFDVS